MPITCTICGQTRALGIKITITDASDTPIDASAICWECLTGAEAEHADYLFAAETLGVWWHPWQINPDYNAPDD